jgi:hypothetical protein
VGILDRLYMPTTKDVQSGQTNVRRFFKVLSIAQVSATPLLVDSELCPADLARLIRSVVFSWAPGAAQTAVLASLVIQNAGTGIQSVSTQPKFNAAATNAAETVSGLELIWLQGENLQLSGVFSAGANSNTVTVAIAGWEFPRASIQR